MIVDTFNTIVDGSKQKIVQAGDKATEITTRYETVRDENGKLIRDENGVPVRDSRDLPPATEEIDFYGRKVTVGIQYGREIPAASKRPDTTYKVSHISVDVDYDFDDEFGQYFAVNRRKSHLNQGLGIHLDADPSFLTDIEQVKRLEVNMDTAVSYGVDMDVTVERITPIAFRIPDADESEQRMIAEHINTCCCTLGTMDYYACSIDENDDMYVWARHVYSYPEWRDEEEAYKTEEQEFDR